MIHKTYYNTARPVGYIAAIAGAPALSAFDLTVTIPGTCRALVGSVQAIRARMPIKVEAETRTGTGIRPVALAEDVDIDIHIRIASLDAALANLKKPIYCLTGRGIAEE